MNAAWKIIVFWNDYIVKAGEKSPAFFFMLSFLAFFDIMLYSWVYSYVCILFVPIKSNEQDANVGQK
jgi:hypothetical protein